VNRRLVRTALLVRLHEADLLAAPVDTGVNHGGIAAVSAEAWDACGEDEHTGDYDSSASDNPIG
jgi:hypothetical protein